jgi:hypothetical protein
MRSPISNASQTVLVVSGAHIQIDSHIDRSALVVKLAAVLLDVHEKPEEFLFCTLCQCGPFVSRPVPLARRRFLHLMNHVGKEIGQDTQHTLGWGIWVVVRPIEVESWWQTDPLFDVC